MVADFEKYSEIHAGVDGNTIRASAEDPQKNTAIITALQGELEGDDKAVAGAIEGDIKAGTRNNPQQAQTVARNLAAKGTYAVSLLNMFAGQVDAFDGKVDDLNTRLHAMTSQRSTSQKSLPEEDRSSYGELGSAAKAQLQGEYDKALSTLDDDADQIATKFSQGATDENVTQLVRAGLIPLTSASLFPTLTLTTDDKYQHYRSRIKAGLMPDFSDMTEEQRLQFTDENPGLLEDLMKQKDPPPQLQKDIIAIAVPHPNGDDGETDAEAVLRAIDEDYSSGPGGFLGSMEHVQDVNNALALLAPWAARNGVDMTHNSNVNNAQDYLENFVDHTWDKQSEIQDYIKDDEHNWTTSYTVSDGTHYDQHSDDGYSDGQQGNMFKAYANAILNTSQEDFGGSWDDLPEDLRHDADQLPQSTWSTGGGFATELLDDNDDFKDLARLLVHGDATGGDDLSKHIASTAVTSTSITDQYWDRQPGDDHTWDDDLASDVLDVVSRNHEATADLLSGEGDLPPNYYGSSYDPDEPMGMPRTSNFNATLFGHDWKGDDEGQVANMYDWMHNAHMAGGHESDLADRAFNGVAKAITETDGGVFKDLMGTNDWGKGESAAQYNRSLALSLTDGVADHLGEFSSEDPTKNLTKPDQVRLMTLLMSDHDDGGRDGSAFRLTTLVEAHEQDRIRDFIKDPGGVGARELAGDNARLSALLDSAAHNEAVERHANIQSAEDEHVRNQKIASGIVATLAGKIPIVGEVAGPATGVANTLVANLLVPDSLPSPPEYLSDDFSPTGSHVRTSNTLSMLQALVQAHDEDPAKGIAASDLPTDLRPPYTDSSDRLADQAATVLNPYFDDHRPKDVAANEPFYSTFEAAIGANYDPFRDYYSLPESTKPDQDAGPFLDDGGWGDHK